MEGVPLSLLIVAVGAIVVGLIPLGWLARRFGRTILRRPQPRAGLGKHALALASGAILVGAGLAAVGLILALQTWRAFTKKTRVAEVQCIELAPSRLRVYFVPIDRDGLRGATEVYDLDGDAWQVGGDVLRFRPQLTLVGIQTVYGIHRVEGRWLKAEDANAHKGTAFDREGGTSASWLQLYRDGARGPLGWLVAGAHGQAVSQLPDRRAIYDLYVTPDGFVVDKRTL